MCEFPIFSPAQLFSFSQLDDAFFIVYAVKEWMVWFATKLKWLICAVVCLLLQQLN